VKWSAAQRSVGGTPMGATGTVALPEKLLMIGEMHGDADLRDGASPTFFCHDLCAGSLWLRRRRSL